MNIEKVKQICKIGQGAACCRYLACGSNGFECLKLIPTAKSHIDFKADIKQDMTAIGDNCEGEPLNEKA